MKNQYNTVKDLVVDERFNRWVKTDGTEEAEFWQNWQAMHPDKVAILLEARQVVLSLSEDRDAITSLEMVELWENIQVRRQSLAAEKGRIIRFGTTTRRKWVSMAAAVAGLLLVSSSVWYWLRSDEMHYQTAAKQTKTIQLPDGSTVILNANSTLRYAKAWDRSTPREIWLSGGAYFQVTHQPGGKNARFLVHTAKVNVEVLGTTFNVLERGTRTKVVLSTGKVKLDVRDQAQTLVMQPGEIVEYSAEKKKVEQRKTASTVYRAWAANQWVLHEVPLREVIQMMEETFGIPIRLENPAIGREKMTGVVPIDDLDKLLQGLAGIYALDVVRSQEAIILRHRD